MDLDKREMFDDLVTHKLTQLRASKARLKARGIKWVSDKALQEVATFLHIVLDEPIKLRLIDSLESFIEKLKGQTN